MKSYYGNYLGVVITGGDKDPEYRGRTQVFVPNIMPALYDNWNEDGQDITFEVIGQITKNVKIKDIDEEFLIDLKIEIDDKFGDEEEFEIETE